MTYENVMEKVKSVPPDKLDMLNEYIVYLVQGEHKAMHDDNEYLCSMPRVKQSIIDGMNIPVQECVTDVGL